MARKSFSVLFFIKKAKLLKNGEAPVCMRITVNGCMVDISIKRSCPVNLWNQAKENSKGKDRMSVELNHYLEITRSHVHQIYRELETSGKVITVDLVRKLYYGVDEESKTLLQVFREHNEQSRKLIGKDFVSKTVQRYETTTRYLEEFIKKEYQLSDIALNNLEANFISKFDAFLKIEKGCAQNSAITRLKNLKKIIRIALENDNILIEVLGEDGIPLAKELMRQAEQMKAKPYFNIVNYELLRIMLENATEEQIKLYGKHDESRMKDMDAYIGIRATSNTSELSKIDSKIMNMYNKYYTVPVHFEERVKRTKWCILRYPNNSMAQMSKMTLEEFEDFYFNVCNLDYSKMSKAMDNLKDLMNKTDNVHILGNDTDLSFSIKGINAEKYVGTFNVPDGEVASAPVKDSVNGYITYNTQTTNGHNGLLLYSIRQNRYSFLRSNGKKKEQRDILI